MKVFFNGRNFVAYICRIRTIFFSIFRDFLRFRWDFSAGEREKMGSDQPKDLFYAVHEMNAADKVSALAGSSTFHGDVPWYRVLLVFHSQVYIRNWP